MPHPDYETYLQIRASITSSFNQINALYSYWARLQGINRNQLYFFSSMENREQATPSELSAEWLISKQTLTSILKDLQKQGFIQLSPNPADKRSKLITLTAKGRQRAESILTPLREMELQYLQNMGLEQSHQLMHSTLAQLHSLQHIIQNDTTAST